MMSKEKRRVPKLRFPGFTEDWEQRKFSEIYERAGQKNDLTYGIDKIISVANMYFKKDVTVGSEEYLKTYNVFKLGDIAFEGHTNKEYRYGRFVENTIGDGIVSHIFDVFTPKINLDINFWKDLIKYEPIMGPILRRCTKASRMMSNLTTKEFLEEQILCPTLEEQKLIGEFIVSLDKNITLHQRKLDNLKLKKKALLQKLFPKNGERYPELRFPGFTDAWEQRKLTDIAKTFIGLVTTMTENYRDSGTLLIRNSDIKEGQFIFSEKPIHLDEEFAEKNKTRRLQIGDVVTVHTGDIGTSAVIKEKEAGAIGFATINTRTDKRILNPYFLSTYFNTDKHKCYANSVSTGDGRSNYNIKDFNKLVISIPTLDEQEKISAIINNINTIITLHQRKLDHLQLQKKALLQQMFV